VEATYGTLQFVFRPFFGATTLNLMTTTIMGLNLTLQINGAEWCKCHSKSRILSVMLNVAFYIEPSVTMAF
jgi:hypothetical protein